MTVFSIKLVSRWTNEQLQYFDSKSKTYLILMHWWILQNVSKMNSLAFSMKSSKQATKKKSLDRTWQKQPAMYIEYMRVVWKAAIHCLMLK